MSLSIGLAKKVTLFWHRGCIFTWFIITILFNIHNSTEEQDLKMEIIKKLSNTDVKSLGF